MIIIEAIYRLMNITDSRKHTYYVLMVIEKGKSVKSNKLKALFSSQISKANSAK